MSRCSTPFSWQNCNPEATSLSTLFIVVSATMPFSSTRSDSRLALKMWDWTSQFKSWPPGQFSITKTNLSSKPASSSMISRSRTTFGLCWSGFDESLTMALTSLSMTFMSWSVATIPCPSFLRWYSFLDLKTCFFHILRVTFLLGSVTNEANLSLQRVFPAMVFSRTYLPLKTF